MTYYVKKCMVTSSDDTTPGTHGLLYVCCLSGLLTTEILIYMILCCHAIKRDIGQTL